MTHERLYATEYDFCVTPLQYPPGDTLDTPRWFLVQVFPEVSGGGTYMGGYMADEPRQAGVATDVKALWARARK